MKARDYVDDESDLQALAAAEETAIGRAILRATAKREKELLARMLKNPQVNCEDVRKDVRWFIGGIDNVGWVKELVQAARQAVSEPAANKQGDRE